MLKKEKINYIVFDEETSPQLGYFFGGKWETNIVKILEYETIVMISYYDSITDKIYNKAQWDFPDWKPGVWNDESLVKYFRDLFLKYDMVVGQNSDAFDIKLFNSRLAYWGLDPLPEYKTFDTKKLARAKLKLPSYSLEDMALFFGFGGKYHHSGLDMWFNSRNGMVSAQKEMVKYCNIDVKRTKQVFEKLLPYVKISNEYGKYVDDNNVICVNPLCNGRCLRSKKRKVVGGYKWQYQCTKCGKYHTPNRTIKD